MIPFPKLHIATSVLNRISNALEEEGPLGLMNNPPAQPVLQEPPLTPSAELLGSGINHKLAEPVPPVAVDPAMQESADNGMMLNSASGGSPFDGALLGASGV